MWLWLMHLYPSSEAAPQHPWHVHSVTRLTTRWKSKPTKKDFYYIHMSERVSVRYVCVIDENFGQIFFVAKWMMPALFRYKRVPHFSKNTTVQYLALNNDRNISVNNVCTVCHTQVINTRRFHWLTPHAACPHLAVLPPTDWRRLIFTCDWCLLHRINVCIIMAALCNMAGHCILPCGFFLLSFFLSFFLSSPNLSGRRLDVCHTSTHGMALVRI